MIDVGGWLDGVLPSLFYSPPGFLRRHYAQTPHLCYGAVEQRCRSINGKGGEMLSALSQTCSPIHGFYSLYSHAYRSVSFDPGGRTYDLRQQAPNSHTLSSFAN